MDETEIKQKLDTLADWQLRRDGMEANKRALLEQNEVPADVQAIVAAGMKQMSEVENSFTPTLQALEEEATAKLALIVVPEEIKAALAEIDRQRDAVRIDMQNKQVEIRNRVRAIKAEVQANTEAKTHDIYSAIAQRKAEIEAEFAGKAGAIDDNIRKLTEEIKAEIKALGTSVKGQYMQAVYVKGRVTWDSSKMDGYAVGHPECLFMRREGEPSVTLRHI